MSKLNPEAEKKIHEEVRAEIKRGAWRILTIFGLGNLLAIGGLYWNVINTAEEIAERTTKSVATKVVEKAVDSQGLLLKDIQKRLEGQSADVAEANGLLSELKLDLARSQDRQSEIETEHNSIKVKLNIAAMQAREVSDLTRNAVNSDTAKVFKVLAEIERSPNAKALLDKCGNLSMEVGRIQRAIASLPAADWMEAELLSGWTNYTNQAAPKYSNAAYCKTATGEVILRGVVWQGAVNPTTGDTQPEQPIFQLPADQRPPHRMIFNVYGGRIGATTNLNTRVDVTSNGEVLCMSHGGLPPSQRTLISLNGIIFRPSQQ